MNWAVYNEILNGILDADGNVSLSPSLGSTRAQCATIISRICEKYGLLETAEPFFPANMEEILADLKSDRVKKVIFDADAGNEIDDQYALAYALGCDKLDVISVSASQFLNKALVPTRNEGMLEGYRELKRVLKLLGRESIPVYKGVGDTTTKKDDDGIKYPTVLPYSADAVTNIINTANSSNEIIYIITTGCATNIACALAKDPSIKDKICVVWLGANLPDEGAACEFNFGQDPTAGRYMMNSGVPLVWLPAMSNDSTKGTQVLKTNRAFLDRSFTGEDAASSFFRYDLPVEHDVFIMLTPDTWEHTFWDVAAPIVLDHPELCELEIINTPRIRGDELYSFEENRPEAIILNRITDPSKALDYMAEAINKLVK